MSEEEINSIVSEQEELAKKIIQLHSNSKKDGASRKNEKYVEQRLETLEEIWNSVQQNDNELNKSENRKHNYFTKNYFQQIKEKHDSYKKYLESTKEELGKAAARSEQALRIKKQAIKLETLRSTINQINKEISEEKTKARYEILQDSIRKQWEAALELHEQLMLHEESFSSSYFKKDEFPVMRSQYEDVLEKLVLKATSEVPTQQPLQMSIRSPQISIPTFFGGYENWASFHDVFLRVIHENTNISKAEKIQLLKTHVKGEAARLIQHLTTTENNYDTAWELLEKRYENKRLLASKLVDKILDLPNLYAENTDKLRQMHDIAKECTRGLENLGIETKSWGPIIIRIISRKWDPETNKMYEQSIEDPHEIQNYDKFMEFLERRFQSLEAASPANTRSNQPSCLYCKNSHTVYQCQQFKSLSATERNRFIHSVNVCPNCLKHENNVRCFSTQTCNICRKHHHTLIHLETSRRNSSRQGNISSEGQDQRAQNQIENNQSSYQHRRTDQQWNSPRQSTTTYHTKNKEESVLLATALVEVNTHSTTQYLRVLIDQGSQSAFITEEAAQRLGLPRRRIRAEITGIGEGNPQISSSSVDVPIKPRFPSNFSLQVNMLVLAKLTHSMPRCYIETHKNHTNEILADPTYMKPGPIDAILGAREYTSIILNGLEKTENGLLEQNTELGWIISGSIPTTEFKLQVTSMISRHEEDNQLTKFWEIEELPTVEHLSEDDKTCERFYEETTYRDENGRYVVRIPFKTSSHILGETKHRAAARQKSLENRFLKDHPLKEQYEEFMEEYVSLGHMQKVPSQNLNQGRYYIPHQAVIREASTTTKLRVVFDASSKSTTNISLNELMYTGPRLQKNLAEILLRWRQHKVVFTADIEKMYRQIKIHPKDRPYQRILWRTNNYQPMMEYELNTVTYGTASAPYLAIKTLQTLAREEHQKYPLASKITLRDFYVDDILSGANDLKSALEIQEELLKMMKSAGFNLRKWNSNHPAIITALPQSQQDQTIQEISKDDIQKSLGVLWSPNDDNFMFKVTTSENSPMTKRHILSEISKVFDPLGWLAPIIIKTKLLIQDLWLQKIEWDEIIHGELATRWMNIRNNLKHVEDIKIPRWIQACPSDQVQLHGFCDASEKAYGAVLYSRTMTSEGKIAVTLLVAKSKVAPIKMRATLPRLELCAAHLLAKLICLTISTLDIPNMQIFAWTDSMIALGWIKGDPNRWKTFVANRVSDIIRNIQCSHWHHVKTNENPADIISRGIDPDKLASNQLWWKGPTWLTHNAPLPLTKKVPDTDQEAKKSIKCLQTKVIFTENITERFSDLYRMIRVLSYCRRFLPKSKVGNISVEEMSKTLQQLLQTVQSYEFQTELASLKKKESINKSSKLYPLNPFVDANQILRVGGRLQNSNLSYNQKHPIILPGKNHLSKLVILDAHQKTLHGGNQATLAYLRRKYWIINGKKAVKNILNKCIKCIRYKAKTSEQQMGQLPTTRVTPSPPFLNTGVDYAGPIKIRATKGRGHKSYKGYISVFVCLTTKAVHLEVVSDMTTDAFLAAFRRFTARRGHCENIYSDNGTNFVGASNHFEEEIFQLTQKKSLQDTIVNIGTTWHFIPPAAPHFGGLWEAGVKSMKHHLKRVIGEETLTYEELTTLLHQIEACLNSRPLWPLSEDVDDYFVLTPGHFLIGREIVSPPDPITTSINSNLSQRWRVTMKMKKDFWNIWSNEYLGRLQQRYKWQTQENNLKKGTMVIIKENTINPSQWPLARVIEIHPGKDNIVRVVTLKKSDGATLKRPIHGLIPLPVEKDEADIPVKHVSNNIVQTVVKTQRRKKLSQSTTSLQVFLYCLLWLSHFLISQCDATYSIKYPEGGLLIEHFGTTQINRGTFRMEVVYNKTIFQRDIENSADTLVNFEKLCNETRKLSSETHCVMLYHHLEEQLQHLKWILKTLSDMNIRQKRGLLGKLLTSVFGVNEEVYEDIDDLNKNQKTLMKTSNQQTKFMISALSTFNATEQRINNRLRRFQTNLNKGLDAIKTMNKWFSNIDTNKLNIHVLTVYQLATNYIEELRNYYEIIINIQFKRGTIYDVVSPAYLHAKLNDVNRKLPSNLEVLTAHATKTSITQNNSHFQIFGYFPIIDKSEFNLIKATPIPLKMTNNCYWTLEITDNYIAIDYNAQTYFQLTKEEFQQCPNLENHLFLCSPDAVRNIEKDSSCLIDEIYQRPNGKQCNTFEHTVQSTVWKQLATPNSWLFITNGSANIAVVCGGVREDVTLKGTGIITMTPNCIIKTKDLTLTPRRTEYSTIGSYSKAVALSNIRPPTTQEQFMVDIPPESFIDSSDGLNKLIHDEETVKNRLHDHIWRKVRHHSSIIGVMTTVTIIIGVSILGLIIKLCIRRHKQSIKKKRTTPTEEFELQSLHSLSPRDGRMSNHEA